MTNTLAACTLAPLLMVLAGAGCQQNLAENDSGLSTVDPQLILQRGGVQFVADSKVGMELAAKQKTPCLLFFTAEWCTYCHQMEETAFADPKIKQLAARFVCVLVDADREPEVCRQYAVSGYPTVQFLAADGRRLHNLVGKQSSLQLASGMNAALQRLAWLDPATTSSRH